MANVSDGKRRATLPPQGAFVLQLQSDADVAAGSIAGRVEHVASGAAIRFASLEELLAFVVRALDPAARPPPRAGP